MDRTTAPNHSLTPVPSVAARRNEALARRTGYHEVHPPIRSAQ